MGVFGVLTGNPRWDAFGTRRSSFLVLSLRLRVGKFERSSLARRLLSFPCLLLNSCSCSPGNREVSPDMDGMGFNASVGPVGGTGCGDTFGEIPCALSLVSMPPRCFNGENRCTDSVKEAPRVRMRRVELTSMTRN